MEIKHYFYSVMCLLAMGGWTDRQTEGEFIEWEDWIVKEGIETHSGDSGEEEGGGGEEEKPL